MQLEDLIKEKTSALLTAMGVIFNGVEVTFMADKKIYRVNIDTEEPSVLIGHHGETIGAVQHVLKVLLWKEVKDEHFNVLVDVDDYRKRQADSVINLVNRKIETLKETGREQTLPPMSPYFRRLVHMHVVDQDGVVSESYGDGERRYVVIKSA